MAKIRVAVLAGGLSSEREVSLRSGAMVIRNLDPERYQGELLDLMDLLPGGKRELSSLSRDFDVAFLALHGRGGEDGTVQGALELLGLPYIGSGVMASALAMNKSRTKQIYRQAGIPTPPSLTFYGEESSVLAKVAEMGYPVVVKAEDQGSSVGVAIAQNEGEFQKAWEAATALSGEILVEKFVSGIEISCGVIGDENLEALPVIEIVPHKSFFDYEAKYTPGISEEIVPARISPELTRRVQEIALSAHRALGCYGLSRTDMVIGERIEVLETNTIPGLTENSLLPQEARAAGIMLPELFDRLILCALKRPSFIKKQVH
ncbi:MAG TPA: D-alanine--D-alanine ligase [Chroococcales cyanobacterium]|jgi:D-alanine-D-alanine ligase